MSLPGKNTKIKDRFVCVFRIDPEKLAAFDRIWRSKKYTAVIKDSCENEIDGVIQSMIDLERTENPPYGI